MIKKLLITYHRHYGQYFWPWQLCVPSICTTSMRSLQIEQEEVWQDPANMQSLFQVWHLSLPVSCERFSWELFVSRLCLSCKYIDAAEAGAGDFTSTFQAVFDRLERLESRVFATEEDRPAAAPDQCPPPSIETKGDNRSDWQLRPSLLQPSYLELIVAMNLSKILEERHTSVRAVSEKYLSLIHDHAPVISKERLERRTQESERLEPNAPFLIFISSILLLTEEPVESFVSSNTASPSDLYRTCKHNFTLFVSFNEPCIELIQSGVLIALYEHAQCMGSQAYLTIGTCARMAGAIGLLSATSSVASSSKMVNSIEEETNILLGIYILDRYYSRFSVLIFWVLFANITGLWQTYQNCF